MGRTPDVVVIGGGIAGVSIAYELAAHRRVTLLEAETSLAVHATGRSAATCVPGHGGPQLRALINASRSRFARLAEELGGPALLRPRPVLRAAFHDHGEPALRATMAEQAHEPDAPVELSPEEALARCPVLRPDVLRRSGPRWWAPGRNIRVSISSPARAAPGSNRPRHWLPWVRRPSSAAHRLWTSRSTRQRPRSPGSRAAGSEFIG